MQEPKPILVVRVYHEQIQDMVSQIKRLEERMSDHHLLFLASPDTNVKFEYYSVKDATDIQLEELKQIVCKDLEI